MKRLAFSLVLGLASTALGAGLQRPNVGGARAVGMGGAYTAVADDPSAVWFNPAGTAFYGDNVVLLGAELILLDRAYQPSAGSPLAAMGAPTNQYIHENTPAQIAPILAVSSRFGYGKQPANRFALSLAVYVPYGGAISFDNNAVKNRGILSTNINDIEIAPALSYQVTDVVAIGAALRIGVGQFGVADNESAFQANFSMSGVGIGGTLGVMVKPHWRVQIGAVYRTPLSIDYSGNGPVTVTGSTAQNHNATLHIEWPQSAGLGIAVLPHKRVMLSAQGDWTAWSSVQQLTVNIEGLTPQVKPMLYQDTFAFHLGAQAAFTRFLVGRLGYTYDSNAIPNSTMRRENQDGNKHTLGFGLGLHFWKLFIDLAFEALLPTPARVISQVGIENEGGSYASHVYSLELGLQFRF
jgi:long-chain fatty acid transport protein